MTFFFFFFGSAIRRFPFLSYVPVFSCEISLVHRLKFPYNFLSHFCFLVIDVLLILVLFVFVLVAVISYVVFESSIRVLFLILFLIYLSRGCKALCIVHSVLVLWFICKSSSLFHFKNSPGYLTINIAQVFVLLMRFLLCNLVSSSFLVLLKYSFLIFFFHLRIFNGVRFQYSQVLVSFLFSKRFYFFLIL